MLKEIQSGILKFFTRDKVIILIALLILGYALFVYSDSKTSFQDSMGDGYGNGTQPLNKPPQNGNPASGQSSAASAGNSPSESNLTSGNYLSQPVANPIDLLPKDQNSQWAALNPVAMNQGSINMPDLLQAGYHIGLDTIGQTLRNANLQLRSDPIIPKQEVGPWMNSTIEPDLARTPLELGYGCK